MLALFEKTWVLWWMLAVLMSRPGFTCSPQLLPGILTNPPSTKATNTPCPVSWLPEREMS